MPPIDPATNIALGPWSSAGVALLSLALLLADIWWRRRHRLSVWITAPQRLLEAPAGAGWLTWTAVPVALLAAGLAIPNVDSAITPFTAWITAFVFLGAGHITGIVPLGGAGLLFAGLGLAAVPQAWFGAEREAPFIGLSLAGLWMLWLARFWTQQLHGDRAWTTTGRLITAARVNAVLLAGGVAFVALGGRLAPQPSNGWTGSAFIAVGLTLIFSIAIWRRAIIDDNPPLAIGGGLAITGAVLAPWLPTDDTPLFLIALVAAAAVFAAQRLTVGDGVRAVLRPFVFLWLPCLATLLFLTCPRTGAGVLGLVLVGVTAAVGMGSLAPRSGPELS